MRKLRQNKTHPELYLAGLIQSELHDPNLTVTFATA